MSKISQTFEDMQSLQRFLISHGVPFASYRLPGEAVPVTIISDGSFSKYSSIKNALDEENGFVMAPFYPDDEIYFLKAHYSVSGVRFSPFSIVIPDGRLNLAASESQAAVAITYKADIQSVINTIKQGKAKKVVISRVIENKDLTTNKVPILYDLLLNSQSESFVYLAYFPGAGLWAGASPELLFRSDKNRVFTVALAGTQKASHQANWKQKERDEQEWVKQYIYDCLKASGCGQIQISETKTVKAGNAIHLKTEFEAEADPRLFPSIIESLHPTPAVCGWPDETALQIISKTENYDREFYTGYLGPVYSGNKISLYVNLRCLQVLKNKTLIYAGGGITADSDPEKEWEETELKSRNMLSAIEKILNLASDSETL
ncbi:MAG: chorismate-binding protein [Lentimicrobium sp.]|nr:chorismate-binding protein [Lentimicrobium sp.]